MIFSGTGTENSGTVNPLHPLEALRELPYFCFSELEYPQFAVPGFLSSTPMTGPAHLFILST